MFFHFFFFLFNNMFFRLCGGGLFCNMYCSTTISYIIVKPKWWWWRWWWFAWFKETCVVMVAFGWLYVNKWDWCFCRSSFFVFRLFVCVCDVDNDENDKLMLSVFLSHGWKHLKCRKFYYNFLISYFDHFILGKRF